MPLQRNTGEGLKTVSPPLILLHVGGGAMDGFARE